MNLKKTLKKLSKRTLVDLNSLDNLTIEQIFSYRKFLSKHETLQLVISKIGKN